jgi:DNA-directed RNA polymerase specialized sigma24 family protein
MSYSELCHLAHLLLSRLALREQQVFVLRYFFGLEGSEIALVFDVTPPSIAKTMRRIERKASALMVSREGT